MLDAAWGDTRRGGGPSMQCFLFLLESFEWLHRWHGHVEAMRVADCSVLGILLREGEREIGPVAAGSACKIEEKIIQFLFVETIFIYIRDLQYHSEIPPPNIEWRKSQGDTQLSVAVKHESEAGGI